MEQIDGRGKINYFHIPVDEHSCSLLTIGTDEFPVHLSFDDLTDYENFFVNWHMQREIEISIVMNGALEVSLPGYRKIFHTGDCFVIFPDVLHSIKKVPDEHCEYRTLLLAPRFLYGYEGSYWENAFYLPLTGQNTTILEIEKKQHAGILAELRPLFEHSTEAMTAPDKMLLQHRLQSIWVKLFSAVNKKPDPAYANDERIRMMLTFLQTHYNEKFSLDALAADIHLSRSECCRYFKKNMNMTLMEYLDEIRVGKAMELLENTSLSMTEISNMTGFSGSGYFSKIFGRKTRMTPLAYRKYCRERKMPGLH